MSQHALNLAAPASDALLPSGKKNWIQLSGHPGRLTHCLVTNRIVSNVLYVGCRVTVYLYVRVSLSGTLIPAGAKRVWKRQTPDDCREETLYPHLMSDVIRSLVPQYYGRIVQNGESILLNRFF